MKLLLTLTLTFVLNTCFSCECLDQLYKMTNDLQKEAIEEIPKCYSDEDCHFYLGQFGAYNRILRCLDALKMKEEGRRINEIDCNQRVIDELSN